MKKPGLLFMLLICSMVCSLGAFAQSSEPVEVHTKYGTFIAASNKPIEFYDNGNVKSVYTRENLIAELPCGKIVISSANGYPLTFYENGNLESAYLPYFRAKEYDADVNMIKTKMGVFEAKREWLIYFYDDETPKSFALASETQISETEILAAKTLVSFHKNGRISELTLTKQLKNGGLISKKSKPIFLDENGYIVSFTVDKGSTLTFNETKIPLEDGSTISFYESGKLKHFVLNLTGIDATIGTVKFANSGKCTVINEKSEYDYGYGQRSDEVYVDIVLYENGNVASASIEKSPYAVMEYSFILLEGDGGLYCTDLECYENGKVKSIIMNPPLMYPVSEDTIYFVSKELNSPDQSNYVIAGVELKESKKGKFYDTRKLFLSVNNKQMIYDTDLNTSVQIKWKDNKPVSYSYVLKDAVTGEEEVIEKKIK